MRDFHTLDVWRKAHQFTLDAFQASESFPKTETFQLAATLRRGAMTVPMKIAEACALDHPTQFVETLLRGRAAINDTENLLLLARDLQFLQTDSHDRLLSQLVEVRRMLTGLMKSAHSVPAQNERQ